MRIGCKHIFLFVLVHCPMQNKLSGHINLILLCSYYLLSVTIFVFFSNVLEEFYIFAVHVIIYPVQVIFSALYLKNSLLN